MINGKYGVDDYIYYEDRYGEDPFYFKKRRWEAKKHDEQTKIIQERLEKK